MKTQCCGYEPPEGLEYPVMWNEFNKVIQCHNCGEIFVPASLVRNSYEKGRDDTIKFVSKFCKEQTERLLTQTITRKVEP